MEWVTADKISEPGFYIRKSKAKDKDPELLAVWKDPHNAMRVIVNAKWYSFPGYFGDSEEARSALFQKVDFSNIPVDSANKTL